MRRVLAATLVTVAILSTMAWAASDRPTAIEYGSREAGIGAVLGRGLDARNTPSAVAVTSDGAVWFRESFTWHPRVARFGPDGSFREFWDPFFDLRGWYRPGGMIVDDRGAFTADGDGVVLGPVRGGGADTFVTRMGPDGSLRRRAAAGCTVAGNRTTIMMRTFVCFASPRAVPPALPNANWATRGPRGDVWFTDAEHSLIGRVRPDGTQTIFTRGLTRWHSGPQFITTGPDGNMWFTEIRDRVGRITQDGRITEFSRGIPHRASLGGIIAGRDGNLWFTLYHGMVLGKITVNGAVTLYHDLVYPSDGHDFDPVAMIVRDREGRLYYNEGQAGRIARVTISTKVAR